MSDKFSEWVYLSRYKVDAELLKPLFFQRSCPVPCDCCPGELPVTMMEILKILEYEDTIYPLLRIDIWGDAKKVWFKGPLFKDTDFFGNPVSMLLSRFPYHGIVPGVAGACPFYTDAGLCALQIHDPNLKPLICRIYPLIAQDKTIFLSKPSLMPGGFDIVGKCVKKSSTGTSGYKLFEYELRAILGDEDYQKLESLSD